MPLEMGIGDRVFVTFPLFAMISETTLALLSKTQVLEPMWIVVISPYLAKSFSFGKLVLLVLYAVPSYLHVVGHGPP